MTESVSSAARQATVMQMSGVQVDLAQETRTQQTTADEFRAMMRGFPTGVVVVTSIDSTGKPRGMTCSSLCSVAVQPPTLLICLRSGSPTLDAVLHRDSFSVNVLHSEAKEVAELFASGAPDRFDCLGWEPSPAGPHLLGAASAIADCMVSGTQRIGDHAVVFGAVRDIISLRRGALLYGFRQYRTWPIG